MEIQEQERSLFDVIKAGARLMAAFLAVLMIAGVILSAASQVQFKGSDYTGSSGSAASYIESNTDYLKSTAVERMVAYAGNILRKPQSYEEYDLAAAVAISKENYGDAAQYLMGCLATCEDDSLLGGLHVKLGCVYALLEEKDAAIEEFDRGIRADGTQSAAYLMRAQLYIEQSKTDLAVSDMEKYLKLAGNSEDIAASAGTLFEQGGKYQEAIEQYGLVLSTASDYFDPSLYFNRARCRLALSDLPGALEDCQIYLGYTDGAEAEGAVQAMMGVCCMGAADYENALSYYHEAIALGYGDPLSLYAQTVLCAYVLGDFAQVLTDGEAALALGDDDPEMLQWVALAHLGLSEYEAARDGFSACIARNTTLTDLYYYRGVCETALENYAAGEADFTVSIQLGESLENCYYNRGLCRMNTGDYENAIYDLAWVLENTQDETLANAALELLSPFIVEDETGDAQTKAGEDAAA